MQPILPDTLQISSTLLTVVVAHARQGVPLYITLVFTDLGHHIFDAEFVVESFHIFTLAAKTLEIDHTFSIQIDVVGH